MGDTKEGREKQADDEERRQRNREIREARDRASEAEPVRDDAGEQLGDLDGVLETQEYPMTTEELVESCGDRDVQTRSGWMSVGDVFAAVDNERYDSADDVRNRILGLIRR